MNPELEILKHFEYDHLPPRLAAVSQMFHETAHIMARNYRGEELKIGLRKLLEAKDCFVRCEVAKSKAE